MEIARKKKVNDDGRIEQKQTDGWKGAAATVAAASRGRQVVSSSREY